MPEFRVDGDGWQNFYGWPTDANAPFQFSNTGTDIDRSTTASSPTATT